MTIEEKTKVFCNAWQSISIIYEEGKLKAIGVSNFYPDRFSDICLFERKTIPQVNQVETNVFNQRINLIILYKSSNACLRNPITK